MDTQVCPSKPLTFLPWPAPASRPAPFLPMSRAEMAALGWDQCDIVLVTGDAYVDHPSFGMAIIGRLLEAQGFRVGIISQPDWQSAEPFKALGKPRLFFGVTGGNLDSMVNRYTADRRLRHDDAYTAGGEGGKRPDRCTIVYTQRCREAYKDVPIILGGIEASLRRIAHYDYWSDKVRRSILADAKADLLIYGNAERAVVEVANRIADGDAPRDIDDVRGVALFRRVPENYTELHADDLDVSDEGAARHPGDVVIRLPTYEQVEVDKEAYARASRVLHRESNPGNARPLVQRHGDRDLWLNPPPIPLTTQEMDAVYDLPYARAPHPSYGDAKIPAWDMIRFSVTIMRGCFGGCTFCSITEHEGRIIQNRSEGSILREIELIRDKTPGFTGVISDIGGPTANMYRMACKDPKIEAACRRPSCVFPDICPNLNTSHDDLIRLYRKVREVEGVKKVMVASGVRYDLAVKSPEYVKELVTHHVGGYLKIAPEHTERGPLDKMMKPGIGTYDRFKEMFDAAVKQAGKKYYLIPYFIAAHPGTTDEDMMNLALWLKKNRYRADQVQTFLPSPMATATAMYHTGVNPLRAVRRGGSERVATVTGLRQRRLHKAFLRYHDPDNWPLLREALKAMGRADLIGPRPDQLVPAHQPP
ncbi:YgiQ family radical SAM protein, partial [Xanthobacter autotrophicus]|uniref:YgiQ family radical SAM protein n=1 Tax=Xanthobacter autotrophicus TaxID=280 RepID=UPI001E496EBB